MKKSLLLATVALIILTLFVHGDDGTRAALAEELVTGMRVDIQINARTDAWQKLKPDVVKAYAEVFTEEELQAILRFYKSATGQTLVNKGAEVARKLMESQKTRFAGAPTTPPAKEDAREGECLSRIRQIGQALFLYTMDHKGMLPRTIEQLVPDYLPTNPATSPLLRSPFADGSTGSSYEFLTPGAKLADLKPETAILRGKFKSPAGRRSVYLAVQKAQLISD